MHLRNQHLVNGRRDKAKTRGRLGEYNEQGEDDDAAAPSHSDSETLIHVTGARPRVLWKRRRVSYVYLLTMPVRTCW